MTFQVARVKEALGSVSQMVKDGNKLVFDQDSSGKDASYIQNNEPMRTSGCDRKTVTCWTWCHPRKGAMIEVLIRMFTRRDSVYDTCKPD